MKLLNFWILVLFSTFILSCSLQINNLKLNTNNNNIILKGEIHDETSIFGGPSFNAENYEIFKNLCRKNNIKCEKSEIVKPGGFNGTSATAIITIECKGFEKANALMNDFRSTFKNCDIDFTFINDNNNNIVRIGFNQERFADNSLIEINNTSKIKYSPSENTQNLSVFNSSDNHVTYQVVRDSISSGIVELKYEYNTTEEFLNIDKENWNFIFSIIGGIVSVITILKLFTKFKIVRRSPPQANP